VFICLFFLPEVTALNKWSYNIGKGLSRTDVEDKMLFLNRKKFALKQNGAFGYFVAQSNIFSQRKS